MEQDPDAIRRCLDGDTDAFCALVEAYEQEALAHARAIVGNVDDSLDVVQEAFLDAFRSLHTFDCSREFYPWFYVILRNRCYQQLKLRAKQPATGGEVCGDVIQSSDAAAGNDVQELKRALLLLAPADREILLLKYIDRLSYRCLAEYLKIPAGTVMSRLYHARCRLREKLELHGN